MDTKKAITIGVVALILIATFAVIAAKNTQKNPSINSPSPAQTTTSTSDVPYDAGDSVQTDSDITSLEADIDSISEEDFGDDNLSDSAVGL